MPSDVTSAGTSYFQEPALRREHPEEKISEGVTCKLSLKDSWVALWPLDFHPEEFPTLPLCGLSVALSNTGSCRVSFRSFKNTELLIPRFPLVLVDSLHAPLNTCLDIHFGGIALGIQALGNLRLSQVDFPENISILVTDWQNLYS